MRNKVSVLLVFLRGVGVPMLLLTVACCVAVIRSGNAQAIAPFFIVKLMVDLLLFYFWYSFRPFQLYYFHNLGFSKRHLFAFALIADMTVFGFIQYITVLWM